MTTQEFSTENARIEEHRAISKRFIAEAEARGDKLRAARCRISLIDVEHRLAKLARKMERGE